MFLGKKVGSVVRICVFMSLWLSFCLVFMSVLMLILGLFCSSCVFVVVVCRKCCSCDVFVVLRFFERVIRISLL